MLLEISNYPIPPEAREIAIETRDGMRLRAAIWLPVGEARGTCLLMQGRAEFIEKYFETVADLLARGFAVVAFDWRGQGGSERAVTPASKGHIAEFDEYRHDIEAIRDQVLDLLVPKPVVGLAHSMGGCIALLGAHAGWLPVSRLVTLAPMVDLKMVKHPRLVRTLIRLLDRLGFGERFVPGGDGVSISTLSFAGNRLSSDRGRYERNAALAAASGSRAIGAPTIGWLAAAYRAMNRLQRPGFAAAIAMPVRVIAAGDDPVCSTPAIMAFAEALKTGPAIVIPEARHEILMETDPVRAIFWRAFDVFTASSESAPSAREATQDDVVKTGVATGDD